MRFALRAEAGVNRKYPQVIAGFFGSPEITGIPLDQRPEKLRGTFLNYHASY